MLMSTKDSTRLDINYYYRHGDISALMTNAGNAIANSVKGFYGNGKKILVACGIGNNGADGIIAGNILSKDNDVALLLFKKIEQIKPGNLLNLLTNWRGEILYPESIEARLQSFDLIIDAIFGTGFHGEIGEPYRAVIQKLNNSGKPILSVDTPSGLGSQMSIRPDRTVTFTCVKENMDEDNSGKITIENIGIDETSVNETGPGDIVFYPFPDEKSHKGMNGRLSIMSGWKFHGSAIMAAMGAQSTSPDLVKIFINHRNYDIIGSQIHSTMLVDCEESEYFIEDLLKADCIIIGPGMGESEYERSTMEKIIEAANVPLILDASAIMILKNNEKNSMGKEIIITPHKGEFTRLTGLDPTKENAEITAKKLGITIFLKGQSDIITDGLTTITGHGGTPRLTMGGTGDLLTGILGGLISKKMPLMRAASFASFINKRAGERCMNRHNIWFGIDELVSEIPEVFKEIMEIQRKLKET